MSKCMIQFRLYFSATIRILVPLGRLHNVNLVIKRVLNILLQKTPSVQIVVNRVSIVDGGANSLSSVTTSIRR